MRKYFIRAIFVYELIALLFIVDVVVTLSLLNEWNNQPAFWEYIFNWYDSLLGLAITAIISVISFLYVALTMEDDETRKSITTCFVSAFLIMTIINSVFYTWFWFVSLWRF